MSMDVILQRLFSLYSTWMIREDDQTIHTSTTSSVSSTLFSSHTLSHHHATPSVVSTLHDSSVGISSLESDEPSNENPSTHSSHMTCYTDEPIFRFRVVGRVDFERCICDILPKYSKSQCANQASRLFDKVQERKLWNRSMPKSSTSAKQWMGLVVNSL